MTEKFTLEQRLIGLGLKPETITRDSTKNACDLYTISESRLMAFLEMVDAKAPEPAFVAVFLDEGSKALLTGEVPAKFSKVFADHMTIFYRPNDDDLKLLRPCFGKEMGLMIRTIIHDSRCQTATVDVGMPDYPISNREPHITLSCEEFTQPGYSNKLLERSIMTGGREDLGCNIMVKGRIGLMMSDGSIDYSTVG